MTTENYPEDFKKWLDREQEIRVKKDISALTAEQIASALEEYTEQENERIQEEKAEAAFTALESDLRLLAEKHNIALLCAADFRGLNSVAKIAEGTTSSIERLGLLKFLELNMKK